MATVDSGTRRDAKRTRAWIAITIAAGAVVAGCGGGFVFGDVGFVHVDDEPIDAVFVFRVRGSTASQDFLVATRSADFVRLARTELQRPIDARRLIVNGRVQRATGEGLLAATVFHYGQMRIAEAD